MLWMRETTIDSTCSIEDCEKPQQARGWCFTHYQRWRRHGDSLCLQTTYRSYCSIDGCENPHHGRGWCKKHYSRWERNGDPLNAGAMTVDPRKRALAKFTVDDGCWLWTAAPDAYGYGTLRVSDRKVRAHRFIYEWLVGPIPEGLTLDHLCRVRHCVRPNHLEPVTGAENLRRGLRARRLESQSNEI